MTKNYIVNNPKPGLKQNLIGKKRGKLLVTKKLGSDKRKKVIWECICDCGQTTTISTHYFNCGKKTSCGCKNFGDKNSIWKGYKQISGTYWASLINGAKNRNLIFDITIEEVWNIFIKQNKKCALSGLEINFSDTQIKKQNNGTASLDRIDNNLGYIKNNIQWLHKDINWLKGKFSQDYFIYLCSNVGKNNESKT